MDTQMLLLQLQIGTEIIGFFILVYILYSLWKAETGIQKDKLLKQYEMMKRDKIFRTSLVILAFSVLCIIIANFIAWDPYANLNVERGFRFAGSIFRVWFFLFLLRTVRATMH